LWITSVRSATLSLRKKTASCTSDETSRTARLRLTALTPSLDRTVEVHESMGVLVIVPFMVAVVDMTWGLVGAGVFCAHST